jgi:hypothetical protein
MELCAKRTTKRANFTKRVSSLTIALVNETCKPTRGSRLPMRLRVNYLELETDGRADLALNIDLVKTLFGIFVIDFNGPRIDELSVVPRRSVDVFFRWIIG